MHNDLCRVLLLFRVVVVLLMFWAALLDSDESSIFFFFTMASSPYLPILIVAPAPAVPHLVPIPVPLLPITEARHGHVRVCSLKKKKMELSSLSSNTAQNKNRKPTTT